MASGVRIAPSILSADMGHLAREIADVERGGADWLHVDIVDGDFAPYLTFGPATVRAARKATSLPLDVHLMVNRPERHVEAFAAAGADIITVHAEACKDLQATLKAIRGLGKRAGVALLPETPAEAVRDCLGSIDLILALCVRPGRAGQAFMDSQLDKIAALHRLVSASGHAIELEVDGGISTENAGSTVRAGASVLVSGSKIFDTPDRAEAIASLRRAASAA